MLSKLGVYTANTHQLDETCPIIRRWEFPADIARRVELFTKGHTERRKVLSLRLLGTYYVSLNDKPVDTFATDKERALLAYLAIEMDRPHRREELTSLLWPELPTNKARNNFRVTLHRLRQALQDSNVSAIEATRETVRINPDLEVKVDVTQLLENLEAERQHDHGDQLCQQCLAWLSEAADLYQGEFLEGFVLENNILYNDWVRLQREWIHLRILDGLERLTQYHLRRGQTELAQKYSHLQIEIEPWKESAHRQMMRSMACTEDYNAALAQFETCERILSEELGIEPSEKTVRLYEDIHAARETHFRPLPNLPAPLIGRKEELSQIVDQLADPACRLLTLVGPGGIGKSSLAVQAAQRLKTAFLHGVCFVPLTPVSSPDRLAGAIAKAANYSFENRDDQHSELLGYLKNKDVLLVLDNFEHLVADRSMLPDLLDHVPGLKILVTSRLRLNLNQGYLFEVGGLDYPESDGAEDLKEYGAVSLFVESARKANPSFVLSPEMQSSVLQICRFLSGIPLGIELAASWTRLLTPQKTLARIRQSLDFLESSAPDAPDRHRSLRAAFDHSWALLEDEERDAMMELSIFRDGFTLEAAQETTGASLLTLTALVDHSLLWHDVSIGRLDMHTLLRQFAQDKLKMAEKSDAVYKAHSAYYLDFLSQHEDDVMGGEGQLEALIAIDAEIENIRAAWHWAIENGMYERLERSIDILFSAFVNRGNAREAEQFFQQSANILEARGDENSKRLLGQILARQASFARRQLRYEKAVHLLERSLEIARQHNAQYEIAYCLQEMGTALRWLAGPHQAKPLLEESLEIASAIEARRLQAIAFTRLSRLVIWEEKHEESSRLTEELIDLCREMGDNLLLCGVLYDLGVNKCLAGWYEEGKRHLEECYKIQQQLKGQRGIAVTQIALALYATRVDGNNAKARALAERSLAIGRSLNSPFIKSLSLVTLGSVDCWEERYTEAARRAEAGLQIAVDGGHSDIILEARDTLALALCGLGLFQEAKTQLCQALHLSLSNSAISPMLSSLAGMALVLANEGCHQRAAELFALAASHPAHLPAWVERLPLYVEFRTVLEDSLSPESFANAWERGEKLNLREAVANVISQSCPS